MSGLIGRRARGLITEALTGFRVVIVNGPRQSGKSTLLELFARETGSLVTLDDRDVLRVARTDLRGLIEGYPRPLMIDEEQRGGEPLVLANKAAVDRAPRTWALLYSLVPRGSSRFLVSSSRSLAEPASSICGPSHRGRSQGERTTSLTGHSHLPPSFAAPLQYFSAGWMS